MNQNRNQPQSLRILPFEGATNFRELGGYLAADGRRVKYGLLYRGATTCDLVSIADRAALGSLGLKLMNQCRSGILGTWDRSGPSGSLPPAGFIPAYVWIRARPSAFVRSATLFSIC